MTRQEALIIARAKRSEKVGTLQHRFWSKVNIRASDECWLWNAAVRRKDEGYGAFWLDGRHQPASKVAWMLDTGLNVPNGMVICHRCDNPSCCNPSHLFLGTNDDNNADRVAKGRQCRGEKAVNAVLTDDLVIRLRKRASELGNICAAAREMGINQYTAWDAVKRRWRHL